MTGQVYNADLDRYTMHAVVLQPPACYSCFSCGLCGDFMRSIGDLEALFGQQAMYTCHGGDVLFEPGWGGDNAFAYDRVGNTWEYEYRQQNCPVPRNEEELKATDAPGSGDSGSGGSGSTVFVPQQPDGFEWVDPCFDSIKDLVVIECQRARDGMNDCCHNIGGDFCGLFACSFLKIFQDFKEFVDF